LCGYIRIAKCERKSDISNSVKMVVGLGNPGDKYADTRHNIGFKVIDSLADRLGVKIKKRKFRACPIRNWSFRTAKFPRGLSNGARFGETEFADKKLILLKPWQFMNSSGGAVAAAVGFYKLTLVNLLVITDDMALEPGRIRIRAKGSAGGHNGLADIIEKLGSNEFARCRIGIGHSGRQIAYDYVLDKPTETEKQLIDEAIVRAQDAVLCWIEYGVEQAMSKFNNS
jgi:PTH1 family peptidyl-tRNA hydrolase